LPGLDRTNSERR